MVRELPPHTYGLPTNRSAYATIELPDAPLLFTEPELPVELLLSELLPELAVLLLVLVLPELAVLLPVAALLLFVVLLFLLFPLLCEAELLPEEVLVEPAAAAC